MLEGVTTFLCILGGLFVLVIILIASGIKIVPEDQLLQVFRLGRYIGDRGPGIVFIIPIMDIARKIKPEGLIGAIGEARTDINLEGSVYVNKHSWAAKSKKPIKAGAHVKIISREGSQLTVVEF